MKRLSIKKCLFFAVCFSLFIFPRRLAIQRPFQAEHPCRFCVLQRDGQLSQILYRAITGEYHSDSETIFGHCFVCIHCEADQDPICFGWWPMDPDGGDYEGDDGRLSPDLKEPWTKASCISITQEQADVALEVLDTYDQSHRYQVLGQGGSSCLGFCADMTTAVGANPILPYGNLTVTGDMHIEGALQLVNADHSSTYELLSGLLTPSFPLSYGTWWSKNTALEMQHSPTP